MNETCRLDEYRIIFSRVEVNIEMLGDDIKNFKSQRWEFLNCNFTPKKVDFSPLIYCKRLYIRGGDFKEITAWPPKIQEIHLTKCKNLKRIPEDPAQYKHLKKFETGGLDLENWDIDLSQSEGVRCVGVGIGFRDRDTDFSEIQHKKNVTGMGFFNSHFLEKTVDFSEFENLEEIFIEKCDLEHITAWPPRLKELRIKKCPNLLSIPLKADQYRYLSKLELTDIFLTDWNIDLTEAYNLWEIKLVNLLAYNPNQVAADPSLPKPEFKIPRNWAYCIGLNRLIIYNILDLAEIPVDFSYNPWIYIEIGECPEIPHIDCLPEPLHECTQVYYSPRGGTYYNSGEPVFDEERKWTPAKTKYLEYMKSVIPKIPSEKLRIMYSNVYRIYSPKVKTSKNFSLYL